jgi:hypothetical protein
MASTNDAAHHQLHAHVSQLGAYGVGSSSGW